MTSVFNEDVKDSNRPHPDIAKSTFLHPYITNVDELIEWGLSKLGYPLIQVELTRQQMEICVADALEKYSKFANFDVRDIMVPIDSYDPKLGLDLSRYNIADIHDISFKRDALLYGFGNDMFFGTYAMMQSYAGSGVFPFFNNIGTTNGSWISLHNLHENLQMINRLTGSSPQWRYFRASKRLVITPTPRIRRPHHPCAFTKKPVPEGGSCPDPSCKDENCPICPNRKGPPPGPDPSKIYDPYDQNVILLTCEVEPPPEELYGNEYVKRLFLALMKIQLGIVRKKFSSVQLIGGGTIDTSIGDEGKEEFDKAMEELRSVESFGNIVMVG